MPKLTQQAIIPGDLAARPGELQRFREAIFAEIGRQISREMGTDPEVIVRLSFQSSDDPHGLRMKLVAEFGLPSQTIKERRS